MHGVENFLEWIRDTDFAVIGMGIGFQTDWYSVALFLVQKTRLSERVVVSRSSPLEVGPRMRRSV